MDFRLQEVLTAAQIIYGIAGIVLTILITTKLSKAPNLNAFPTVGSTGWLGSWWSGFKYLANARDVIQEGYEKHKSKPFKVAEPGQWTVILTDRKHLEEVVKASDSELSISEASNDRFQLEHMLGPQFHHNTYHITVFRHRLMRNMEVLYPEIRDEVVTSFAEVLDLRDNEWKSVPALTIIGKVICRASNRVFVGLPLCRNPEWMDLGIRFSVDLVQGSVVIGLFPKFMRPLATRFLTQVPRCIARGIRLLGPMIHERQTDLAEYGTTWDDKPNDLLSWLMDEAKGPEATVERLTTRVLLANFASIHASMNSFTMALFRLAANPQYVRPLREEVEAIVEKDGWSKTALDKMRNVDSFLKECQRMEGVNTTTLARKALKDVTFSDGTCVPKGTTLAAPILALHHDADVYSDPDTFEPFRFADEEDGPKRHFTSTSVAYLAFGHGRHACPGRFLAAAQLKFMLAHVVLMYDVKLADDDDDDNAMARQQRRPTSLHVGNAIKADPRAEVVFRNRIDRDEAIPVSVRT